MKLIHLTDTHLVAAGETLYGLDPQARLDACIADINANHGDATLAVITGDLTHFGDAAAFAALRTSLDRLIVPVRLCVGNHDSIAPLRAAFPEVETDPDGAVQSVLDTLAGRLVFLDTTTPGSHGGWFDTRRLDWLEARIREVPTQPVFLFMHHPPFPVGVPAMDRISLPAAQAQALAERLAPYRERIRHLFFGHVHRPISGSWHAVPFSTLRATNHQVAFDLHTADQVMGSHEPPAYAVVLIAPEQVVIHTHDFLDASRRFSLSDVDYDFWDEKARRVAAA